MVNLLEVFTLDTGGHHIDYNERDEVDSQDDVNKETPVWITGPNPDAHNALSQENTQQNRDQHGPGENTRGLLIKVG